MFIQLRNEPVCIPVTGGFALIDSDLVEIVRSYNWYVHSEGYLRSDSKEHGFYMHQLVAGVALNPWTIDHINRSKTDNRRRNLRFISKSANNYNRNISTKGYYWRPNRSNWVVRFTINNKLRYFGTYYSEQEAKERADEVYKQLIASAFNAN